MQGAPYEALSRGSPLQQSLVQPPDQQELGDNEFALFLTIWFVAICHAAIESYSVVALRARLPYLTFPCLTSFVGHYSSPSLTIQHLKQFVTWLTLELSEYEGH